MNTSSITAPPPSADRSSRTVAFIVTLVPVLLVVAWQGVSFHPFELGSHFRLAGWTFLGPMTSLLFDSYESVTWPIIGWLFLATWLVCVRLTRIGDWSWILHAVAVAAWMMFGFWGMIGAR